MRGQPQMPSLGSGDEELENNSSRSPLSVSVWLLLQKILRQSPVQGVHLESVAERRASQTREKAKKGVNEQVVSRHLSLSILLGSMPRHIRAPMEWVEGPTWVTILPLYVLLW